MFNNEFKFSGKIKVSENNNPRGLYPHQQEAINNLLKASKEKSLKTLLVIPTGGGKTFTSVYFTLKYMINKNKKVLWIAHRQELLNQTLKTAKDSAYKDVLSNRESFSYRIISGADNHDRAVNIDEDDDFIIASKDSLHYNKNHLERWLKANEDNVCLVIDEAHHATAKTYRGIIKLVEKYSINDCKIIGLTATPMRTVERENGLLGRIFKDGTCYSTDLNTLINNETLAKPIPIYLKTNFKLDRKLDKKEMQALKRNINLPDYVANTLSENAKRNNLIVNHYIEQKQKYGKCLVFAVNINNAIALNALFNEKGIRSDFVVSSISDGKTSISNEENERKIIDFRNDKLDVLINVNILTEGTDIPNVQTVFLARPTTSKILMSQMIGRGLRGKGAGGTDKAYIVSFIDDWNIGDIFKTPKDILLGIDIEEELYDIKNKTVRNLKGTQIPVKLIEELAKMIDSSLQNQFIRENYSQIIPLGTYCFEICYDDYNENCEILLFDSLKIPYEELMNNLEEIFKTNEINVEEDKLNDEDLDKLYDYVYNEIFEGYNLSLGYKEDDIKDILTYFGLTGEIPTFVPFEGREEFDVGNLVDEIIEKRISRFEEDEFLKSKWNDINLGWSIYFGNDEMLFRSEVDREVRNRFINKIIVPPTSEADDVDFEKLSLSQLYKLDKAYYKKLRDEVFRKYTDEEGYFFTDNYKSKNCRDFKLEYIVPINEGGLTNIDNLRLFSEYIDKLDNDSSIEEDIFDKYETEIYDLIEKNDLKNSRERALDLIEIYNDARSYNLLGEVYHSFNKYKLAMEQFEKALKLDENYYEANFNLAIVHSEDGEYEKSNEFYQIALKIDEESAACYHNMGLNYFELEDYKTAVDCYNKAIELEEDELTYELRDEACLEFAYQLDIEETEEVLELLYNENRFNACETLIDYILDTYYEKSIKAYNIRARINLIQEDARKCIANINNVLKLDKDNKFALITKVKHYTYLVKNYSKALEVANNLVNKYQDKETYMLLADVYYNFEKFDESLQFYERVIKLDKDNHEANFRIGWCLCEKEEHIKSNFYYQKVLQINPEWSPAYNNIGVNYEQLGYYEEAKEYYEKALEVETEVEDDIVLYKNNMIRIEKLIKEVAVTSE